MFDRVSYLKIYGLQMDPLFDYIDILSAEIAKLKPAISDKRMVAINRDRAICVKYKEGLTLQAIGDIYQITRERVRQILSKYGIKSKDGGCSKIAKENKLKRFEKRNEKCIVKHGCSIDNYKHLVENGVTNIYKTQRFNAIKRGIAWEFNLWGWYCVWLHSRKLHLRGRKKGQYVMARFNDCGPYSKGNVKIITCSENIIETRARESLERKMN